MTAKTRVIAFVYVALNICNEKEPVAQPQREEKREEPFVSYMLIESEYTT